MNELINPSGIRIDRWLWAARFFKTRALACDAVKAGHICLNGTKIKPSKTVRIGDILTIARGLDRYTVEVFSLTQKRGSATIAQTLYREQEQSIIAREKLAQQRKFQAASAPAPDKRPNKKARRQIIRFQSQE
ncbi:MAG: S4 domain-containing protein [Mariprofundales bacterium]